MKEDIFLFQLSKKLEYSKEGDFHHTATIEIEPPSMTVFKQSSAISQKLMQAVFDAKKYADDVQENDKDVSSIDGKAIKMIFMQSKNVLFSDVVELCIELFIRAGTYDGKTPLKRVAFNRIDLDDVINLTCGYIANFIWPSLFSAERAGEKTNGDT